MKVAIYETTYNCGFQSNNLKVRLESGKKDGDALSK